MLRPSLGPHQDLCGHLRTSSGPLLYHGSAVFVQLCPSLGPQIRGPGEGQKRYSRGPKRVHSIASLRSHSELQIHQITLHSEALQYAHLYTATHPRHGLGGASTPAHLATLPPHSPASRCTFPGTCRDEREMGCRVSKDCSVYAWKTHLKSKLHLD